MHAPSVLADRREFLPLWQAWCPLKHTQMRSAVLTCWVSFPLPGTVTAANASTLNDAGCALGTNDSQGC